MSTLTAPAVSPEVVTAPETFTPMRPSEALRLGRMLVPARAVQALVRRRRGEIVRACELGAMAVALGCGDDLPPAGEPGQHWWPGGFDAAPRIKPPCACLPRNLNWALFNHDRLPGPRVYNKHRAWRAPVVVAHLSDDHGNARQARFRDYWPTTRIVAWLESLGL